MSAEQPVGPPVDATPADFPGYVTLTGRFGTIERLNAKRHGPSLVEAMRGNDPIWTYIFVGPFAGDAALLRHLAECEANKERIFYAVVTPDGSAIGILALMEIRPAARVIEVGNICFTHRRCSARRSPPRRNISWRATSFETLALRAATSGNAMSLNAAVPPGGDLRLGFSYRRYLPPAHDRQRPEPRQRLFLDAG